MRGEIRQLQQRLGVTTIMVTHDQEEALSMADRVVVMNHGVIEQVGTPLQVYEQPATPFVADFLGKVNVLERGVRSAAAAIGSAASNWPRRSTAPRRAARCASTCGPKTACCRLRADRGPRRTRCAARSGMLDFLGTYCLASVDVEGFDGQQMLVYFSLNQALEMQRHGRACTVDFALRGDRVRVFARA